MSYHYSTTVSICQQTFPLDLEVGPNGELLAAKDRFRDLPEAARRLMLGDDAPKFYETLELHLDLLGYAVPLWFHGLSTPEYFDGFPSAKPKKLRKENTPNTDNQWVQCLYKTFNDHAPHWYHTAHVLTQIFPKFGDREIYWNPIVYLLQSGNPLFEPIISSLLNKGVKEDSLRARLLNALLYFPTPKAWHTVKPILRGIRLGSAFGQVSLVRTLNKFNNSDSSAFRQRFFEFAINKTRRSAILAGYEKPVNDCLKIAWEEIQQGSHTSPADVVYILQDPDVKVQKLVETLSTKPDWREIVGRFRTDFLANGYTGPLALDLDSFVGENLELYKWPSGERHNRRIDADIRYALYQKTLNPETLILLSKRLSDKDAFRRENAAAHLAAYCQFPKILVRRTKAGKLKAFFQDPPAKRPALSANIVNHLLSLTIEDLRISTYHFAARAISQLALDETHGEGITNYLIERAHKTANGKDLVFCSYLLLFSYHFQSRQAEIKALAKTAIQQLTEESYAAFGRQLVQLYDPDLTHAFLEKIAPQQVGKTYALFENMAQAVNLLRDEYYQLPLAVFHPDFSDSSSAKGTPAAS